MPMKNLRNTTIGPSPAGEQGADPTGTEWLPPAQGPFGADKTSDSLVLTQAVVALHL